ncbi:MAG: hypothetical protein K2J68_03510, partial [Treponemataceae bacterium]|nr:hypothetical protein [Treponemataceae bacterium]
MENLSFLKKSFCKKCEILKRKIFLCTGKIFRSKLKTAPRIENIFTRAEILPEDDFPEELRGAVFCADEIEADDEILRTAKKVFGIQHLMPWQRLVVGNILDSAEDLQSGAAKKIQKENSDADFTDVFCLGRQIVLLPTGAGKSLCFLLPAVLLSGPTLIFYPLLALMSDQARRIEDRGIECVIFRGGQSEEEREENFRRIKNVSKINLANHAVLL